MSHESAHSHGAHDTHHVNYLAVFGTLCVCTALSVVFDALTLPKAVLIVLVMAVASAKALCVMMFFMHLKFEGNWKFVLLAPTTILAIGLPLALFPDIGRSYYTSTAPQTTQWVDEISEYQHHHAAEQAAQEAETQEPAAEGPAEPGPAEGAGG
jgi:cytochrome c oxidase subunit IV